MLKRRRIPRHVKAPFIGLDRSGNSEDLKDQNASVASEIRFEQGYIRKREGRAYLGGTASAPLNNTINHIAVFRQLDGTEKIMLHTADKVYTWVLGEDHTHDVTGAITLSSTKISSTTFVNKYYFGGDVGTVDVMKYDMTTLSAVGAGYPAKLVATFGERLILLNTYEGAAFQRQRMRWSAIGDATTWSATDFVDLVSQMGDDEIVGYGYLANALIIFGRTHIVECTYTGSTTTPFAFVTRSYNKGLIAHGGVVSSKTEIYFLDATGLHIFDMSLTAKPIDGPVNRWFRENSATAYLDKCVLGRSDGTDELILYYPATGQTANNKYLALNLKTGVWTEGSRVCTATATEEVGTSSYFYTGQASGIFASEFSGTDYLAAVTDADFQTRDFVYEDDGGAVFMSLEFEALGDSVTTSYSEDEGSTWTALATETLTAAYVRYRQDFEIVSKKVRFRFRNNTSSSTFKVRWFRLSMLRTTPVGTLPT